MLRESHGYDAAGAKKRSKKNQLKWYKEEIHRTAQLSVPVCNLLCPASVLAKANEQLAEELAATRARYEAVGALLHGSHCSCVCGNEPCTTSLKLLPPLPTATLSFQEIKQLRWSYDELDHTNSLLATALNPASESYGSEFY